MTRDPSGTGRPLEGVVVLDLSRVLAGPYCTMLLADMGATVWKLEPPFGDDTRRWGPPFVGPEEDPESGYYLSVNRNKKGLAVDLKHPDGRSLARRLALAADVLIENGRPGDAARYGLDAASLTAEHPELIYLSISGFGQDGPRAGEPGYDAAIQALSGLMAMTGEAARPPVKVGVALIDVLTGVHAAAGVAAALARRAQGGGGARLEISLFETALASFVNQSQNALLTGEAPARLGSAHPNIVPYQAFEAIGGPLMIAVGNDSQFAALAAALGRAEWADDPRFATNPQRVTHRGELVPAVARIVAGETRAAWLERFAAAGVPATPVATVVEALADPQVAARGARVTVEHPDLGPLEQVASPLRFARSEPPAAPPPRLGQHTREVLTTALGMSDAEVDALAASGAVVARD